MHPSHPDFDPNYQTFCIYCQEDQGTFERLKRHLQRKHTGTYAEVLLARES
jgi:hypothetical protein